MNRKALMASTLAVALLAAVLGMAPTASASRPQTRAAAAVASGIWCEDAKAERAAAVDRLAAAKKRLKKAKAVLRAAKKAGKPTRAPKLRLKRARTKVANAELKLTVAEQQAHQACVVGQQPFPVTGLSASNLTEVSVTLSWVNPVPGAAGLTIRRAVGSVPPTPTNHGTLVANPDMTTTAYTDTTLSSGTTYSYSVFVRDDLGNFSTPANITVTTLAGPDTTAPGAVADLDIHPTSSTVAFTWTSPAADDLAGVEIRRAAGEDPPGDSRGVVVFTAAPSGVDYTDSGLAAGATYSYSFITFDSAGNRGAARNSTVSLPDEDATGDGIVPNPDTIEPTPDLVRSVLDHGDGTLTLAIGAGPVAAATTGASKAGASATWRAGTAEVSGTPVTGQNQCAYFGFRLTGGQPGSTLIRPNPKTPYGVMLRNATLENDLSGSFCTITGPRATVDEAYKTFDKQWTLESGIVGPRYSGDVGYANKAQLPFGCEASSGATFSATADFSNIKGRADIKWKGTGIPSVEFSVTAAPTFTLAAEVTGELSCTPKLGKGLFIPLGSTPLILELKPEATATINATVNASLTFKPTLTLSTNLAKNALSVPAPALNGVAEATLDAGLYLNASLLVGGVAGIKGKVGPHLTAPLTSPFCGDLSIHAALSLELDVLFRNWTQPLASGDFAQTKIGDCPGPPPLNGYVELGPTARRQSKDAQLDYSGKVLLHDADCRFQVTPRATKVTTPVGDDNICFETEMTSDSSTVIYPQYARKSIVPATQPTCPDPGGQGYLYRWDRAAQQTTWVDLGGACFYQGFSLSDNGRYLFVKLDASGVRLMLRDLVTGKDTLIESNCSGCWPKGVSNDGNRVLYTGRTQLVRRNGEMPEGQTESAVYVWERGSGSTLIAGGDSATLSVYAESANRDVTSVAFTRRADVDGSKEEPWVWRDGGGAQRVPLPADASVTSTEVSWSADGRVAAFAYYLTGDDSNRAALFWPGTHVLKTLEDLGFARTASELVVSGDGHTIAFATEEKLVPGDVDSSTAYDDDSDWYYASVPDQP